MSTEASSPAAAPPTKKVPANIVVPPKKAKLSKAERRALQEQQRAAKAGITLPPKQLQQQQTQAPTPARAPSNATSGSDQQKSSPTDGSDTRQKINNQGPKGGDRKKSNQISRLSHLPPYRDPHDHGDLFFGVQLGGPSCNRPMKLHPAVLETGLDYATSSILGANARCRAMLQALGQAIRDYIPPVEGDLRNHVVNHVLKPSFTFWTQECRPHSVSMGNAFIFVKSVVAALDRDMAWEGCRLVLQESIDAYVQERIDYADLAIANVAFDMISNGDVILTYANSEAIQVVLLEAHKMNTKKFRVIVVDAKPLFEGKVLLRSLREAGLDCTYILLNALSYVMKDVTKILLGAKGLLNDGSVYGRVGTACVAMVAKDIPVLVCAETYKISNRVQLEAFTNNEQGNPEDVVEGELGDNLRVINLLYDLTPAASISGIITEMGVLPPTSVAVLLREMNPQNAYSEF